MTKEPEPKTAHFEVDGLEMFCDEGIAEPLKNINKQGHVTLASCSGMVKDHGKKQGTYIHFDIGHEIAITGHPFDFPYDIGDEVNNYAQCLEEAMEDNGFITNRTKYLLSIPVVDGSFHAPTGPLDIPEKHTTDEFLKAVDERDKRDKGRARHLSDDEIRFRFDKLAEKLEGCKIYIPERLKERRRELVKLSQTSQTNNK